MDNKELLRHLYLELSPSDRKKFLSNLPDDVKPDQSKIDADTFDELMRKERFPEGICCPHCGNVKVGTHGSYKGNPRYICYGCKKTFNLTSRSVFNGHKQSLETYTKYIKLMTMGTSIRKAAQICGISVTTSFLWRHKFLDVLQQIADKTKVGGIVEADETYVKLSFKGSRVLPRLPHKRGNDLDKKFLDSDGIPTPKVCVPCAVDRNDHTQTTGAIARATNLEKPMTKHLSALFENRIVPDSILCTDKLAHYVKVAEQFDLNLIQFKANRKDQSIIRSSVGNFHINNVNNYKMNVNMRKLGETLNISRDQSEKLEYAFHSFNAELMSVSTMTLEDRKPMIDKVVRRNLSVARGILTKAQYRKYLMLINATLRNRGLR